MAYKLLQIKFNLKHLARLGFNTCMFNDFCVFMPNLYSLYLRLLGQDQSYREYVTDYKKNHFTGIVTLFYLVSCNVLAINNNEGVTFVFNSL